MTLGQFLACRDGWSSTHGGPEKPEPPTEEEFEAMKRQHGDI